MSDSASEEGSREEAARCSSLIQECRTKKCAFALGGLAGNNAHGAGFLQAALDRGRVPEMISCTSGQIRWVYDYLGVLAESDPEPAALRAKLTKFIAECAPTTVMEANLGLAAIQGVGGKFGTDCFGIMGQATENSFFAGLKTFMEGGVFGLLKNYGHTVPATTLKPYLTEDDAEKMAERFEQSNIGILFNAFDIKTGDEIVYVNKKARELTGDLATTKKCSSFRTHCGPDGSAQKPRTRYLPCTAAGIYDALWLLQYGFGSRPTNMQSTGDVPVDGAYFRDIILSELTSLPVIYVARPVSYKWIGPLPTSYLELEDLKTELWFNGAYQGERDKIMMINRLLDKKIIPNKEGKYHKINLIEVETKIQSGYYDYIFERMSVFVGAYDQALNIL